MLSERLFPELITVVSLKPGRKTATTAFWMVFCPEMQRLTGSEGFLETPFLVVWQKEGRTRMKGNKIRD